MFSSIASAVIASTVLTIDKSTAELARLISWSDSPNHLRVEDQIDRDFTYICPENGSIAEVTGTDVYATSSSICTAAVHAGVIKVETGGVVKIRIKPESDVYQGSKQHQIESSSNGPPVYNSSFIVLDAKGQAISSQPPVQKQDLDTGF